MGAWPGRSRLDDCGHRLFGDASKGRVRRAPKSSGQMDERKITDLRQPRRWRICDVRTTQAGSPNVPGCRSVASSLRPTKFPSQLLRCRTQWQSLWEALLWSRGGRDCDVLAVLDGPWPIARRVLGLGCSNVQLEKRRSTMRETRLTVAGRRRCECLGWTVEPRRGGKACGKRGKKMRQARQDHVRPKRRIGELRRS